MACLARKVTRDRYYGNNHSGLANVSAALPCMGLSMQANGRGVRGKNRVVESETDGRVSARVGEHLRHGCRTEELGFPGGWDDHCLCCFFAVRYRGPAAGIIAVDRGMGKIKMPSRRAHWTTTHCTTAQLQRRFCHQTTVVQGIASSRVLHSCSDHRPLLQKGCGRRFECGLHAVNAFCFSFWSVWPRPRSCRVRWLCRRMVCGLGRECFLFGDRFCCCLSRRGVCRKFAGPQAASVAHAPALGHPRSAVQQSHGLNTSHPAHPDAVLFLFLLRHPCAHLPGRWICRGARCMSSQIAQCITIRNAV